MMRLLLHAFTVALALAPTCAAGLGFDDVVERARQLARAPYDATTNRVPDWLVSISYDQWRDIRFRPDRALWRGTDSPFQVQFFHPGLYYPRAVTMHVVDDAGVSPLPFGPEAFDYGKNTFGERIPAGLGVAGFRLHYPIKTASYYDEVLVFLGASYLRAIGRKEVYGLSARGLAIDTVEPSGEEFPYFTDFWLVRPAAGATAMTLYALLDSRHVSGAYQFVVHPGEDTIVDVEARLFFRDAVMKLGIAPLTSMFFFGENTIRPFIDYRPEVHDSDGLLLHSGSGEWLWRPLDNPSRLHVSAFQLENPRGFGLVQRDRAFEHYQDLETRAELRPSVWITPRGDWGSGRLELIELPTDTDIHDNVISLWVPARNPAAGDSLALTYGMAWYGADRTRPSGGRVEATRRDRGTTPGTHRFVIDFGGDSLAALTPEAPVRAFVSVAAGEPAGEIVEQIVAKNPVTGGWRLTFQVRPARNEPLELRAFLAKGDDVLTETWSYVVLP